MRALAALIFIVLNLTACGKNDQNEIKSDSELPEVFVIEASEQPYQPQQSFNARIESRSDIEIVAQISGKITAIHFQEGDEIKAGAPLYDIDPAPFKAALSQAKAERSKANANLNNSVKNFARGKKLVKDGYISASEYDTLEAKELESKAALEAAEAKVESAQVDLNYTNIIATQSGRLGRSKPALGDVVSPQYGKLTSLVGKDDMEVVFQLAEKILLAARNESKFTINDIEVAVTLSDGNEYQHKGKIDYMSNRVDPNTGTMEARAHIPNPDDFLRPGLYVRATIRLKQPLKALMVPQAAIQVDQRGTYVLTVDDDNTVKRNNVTTDQRVGENVLVTTGLKAGIRVVVRGVQIARTGQKVTATPFVPATPAEQGDDSDQ